MNGRNPLSLAILVMGLGLGACKPDTVKKQDDTGGGGNGAGSGGAGGGNGAGSGTGGEEVEPMTISGVIRVQLYREESNGDISFLPWDESGYGDTFPFGGFYVGAVADKTDVEGAQRYLGDTVVFDTHPEGTEYTIRVGEVEGASTEFRLFAALDYYNDFIIHSSDPIGLHPDEFTVQEASEVPSMDITVLAPWEDFSGEAASTSENARRDCSDGVTLTGPVDIEYPATTMRGIVFTQDMEKNGPLDWEWFDATEADEVPLQASYSLLTCKDQGYQRLMGAIDSNLNDMIDPADLVGTYAPNQDTNGNPVTIASEDLDDMRVQIPLFDLDGGINVVPFVSLSGDIGVGGGTFDDLPPGSQVVIAALKRRPQGGLDLETLEGQVYDYEVWEWPDLQGNTTVSYDLTVPSNTLMYLWAFADTDANGRVNEAGEPIASGGIDDNGRLTTDTSSQVTDLFIGYAPTR